MRYVGTITTGDETSDNFLRLSLGSALSNLFLSPRFGGREWEPEINRSSAHDHNGK